MIRAQNQVSKFVFFEKVRNEKKGESFCSDNQEKIERVKIQNCDYQVKTYQESREYHE
jgi:hypothetical protein